MTDVPRSMEATAPDATATVERLRRSMPSGWVGAILLVASEACLFGCLIASYFYLRFDASRWPPPGIEKPAVVLPLVFTAMLVATCLPIYLGVRAAKAGAVKEAWWLIFFATGVQATYLGLQIWLFTSELHKFTPQSSAYGSVYYALLGLHHAHVAVGIALDLWVLAKLFGGRITNYRLIAVRVLGLYWYFVSAMAIFIVFTQLFPSL
jgi:heme/copper-type cytochrome/quinol oxidase subunit 3